MLTAVRLGASAAFALAWLEMGWTDWNEQKIRNRLLRRWLLTVLAVWAALAVHTALGERGLLPAHVLWPYYLAAAGYLAVSAAAAYVFWALRVWPAGDVKLFVLLSLYYPLMRLPADFRSGLRFLEVLINTFIPAAAFLFVTAGWYLWRTRFKHQSEFLARVGPARWAAFAAEKARAALPALRAEARAWLEAHKDPRVLARDFLSWAASVVVMSMISYGLGDLLRSDFLKTVVCFALFFLWSRIVSLVGRWGALGLVGAGAAVALAVHPGVRWADFARVFGDISLFSLCIFFGVQIAFKVVAGQGGFAFLPFVFMFVGLIPWDRLASWLIPSWHPAPLAALSGLWVWAAMGLFFGLSLVFVRIWDAESYQSVPPKDVRPYMNLGPALVARLEEDEEFFADFGSLYADGLTPEQVEALRAWCADNEVAVVPLAPTISFANWIFLGYALTCVLDTHVLRLVY